MDVWEDGTWSDIRAMTRDYLQGRRDTTHDMYLPPDPAHIASDGPALLELNELGVVTTSGQHQIAHTQRAYVVGMFVVPQGIERDGMGSLSPSQTRERGGGSVLNSTDDVRRHVVPDSLTRATRIVRSCTLSRITRLTRSNAWCHRGTCSFLSPRGNGDGMWRRPPS